MMIYGKLFFHYIFWDDNCVEFFPPFNTICAEKAGGAVGFCDGVIPTKNSGNMKIIEKS